MRGKGLPLYSALPFIAQGEDFWVDFRDLVLLEIVLMMTPIMAIFFFSETLLPKLGRGRLLLLVAIPYFLVCGVLPLFCALCLLLYF